MHIPPTQGALYDALKLMVEATLRRSPLLSLSHSGLSPKAWLKEHRTVRFGLGRRMGHTGMGLRLCAELFPNRSLFLSPGGLFTDPDKIQVAREYGVRFGDIANVPKVMRGGDLGLVVVDQMAFVSNRQLNKLLTAVAIQMKDPLVVLLQ